MDNSEITKEDSALSAVQSLVAVLILMCSLCVIAGEYVPTFFDMDKDGDTLISMEEAGYWSVLLEHWSRLDANQDGAIDLPEWEAIDIKALKRN